MDRETTIKELGGGIRGVSIRVGKDRIERIRTRNGSEIFYTRYTDGYFLHEIRNSKFEK